MYQQGNLFTAQHARRAVRPPVLLVELPPWRRVFFSNLVDTLLGVKPLQPLISARPAPFWPDVFVERPVPWRRMAQSAVFHVLMTAALVALGEMWLRPGPQVRMRFDPSQITYEPAADDLPPIDTGKAVTPQPRKGEPAYARQQIVSLPPLHDNTHQTVITPDKIQLPSDVELPNMVSWNSLPGPAPAEAIADKMQAPHLAESVVAPPPEAAQAASRLIAPVLPVDVAPPPPDALRAEARMQAPGLPMSPVAPPPDATRRYKMTLPNVGEVTVIEPPPSLANLHSRTAVNAAAPSVVEPPVNARALRSASATNIAHLDPQVAAPPEPMRIRSGAGSPARAARAVDAPPASVVAGASSSTNSAHQIIALSLKPALPSGPVTPPAGSRYGEFAATPAGKPDAPGTPDIQATGRSGGATTMAKLNSALPPGISVAPAPPHPASPEPAPPTPPAATVNRSLLAAAAMPMRVADIARQTRVGSTTPVSDPDPIDREVFGARRYYTMQLNMPNLTSITGSWVIRFAELNVDKSEGDVMAPAVMVKVDPKYPPEAVRNRVEGVVVLHAVIHRDGSVGEVRVLHGIDTLLDANACSALQQWRFRPGTKNGAAVDLEAVVQIPFQGRKISF